MKKSGLWGVNIPIDLLSEADDKYLQSLPACLPTVEWVWAEMDRIWDYYKINNKKALSDQAIAEFYSHPVWLMNGIFTSLDPISVKHRDVIAQFISDNDFKLIADYAGGFGELAIKMANKSPDSTIKIIEPYPSVFGSYRLKNKENVEISGALGIDEYDVIIAQDILEHVEDPIGLAIALSESVQDNGLILFANCFYPVIKCHLPKTFHLRYTFHFLMLTYGLKYQGKLPGAEHVLIFKKTDRLSVKKLRVAEKISQFSGGVINYSRELFSKLKRKVKS
ncbi:methyltransferase domain-containing protein [Methylophilaceae bacterium Uisw_099_01]